MTTDPRALRRLHTELRDIARELTTTIERTIIRDDQSVDKAEVPSLLEQLRDEIQPDNGARRGSGGGGSPAPMSVEAADMLAQIETDAVKLHLEALATEHTVESRIQAVAAIAGRWTDQHQVEVALGYLRKFRDEINGFLDPPQRLHLEAPCPVCDATMVKRWDPVMREHVQVYTLQFDATRKCMVCVNPQCGSEWPTAELEHLARVIDDMGSVKREDGHHG